MSIEKIQFLGKRGQDDVSGNEIIGQKEEKTHIGAFSEMGKCPPRETLMLMTKETNYVQPPTALSDVKIIFQVQKGKVTETVCLISEALFSINSEEFALA